MERLSTGFRNSALAHSIVLFLVNSIEFLIYWLVVPLTPIVKTITKNRFMKMGGIAINPDPKSAKLGDLNIFNDEYYALSTGYRSLGRGEAYMKGYWNSNDLEEFFFKLLSNDLQYHLLTFPRFSRALDYLKYGFFNLQTPARSWEVGQKHYDLGNEFYEQILDTKTMAYTCAYWKNAKTLEEAQTNKMELIAQKLQLKPGMRVLDIGCGWGGLCEYLAANYKVQMVGCTIGAEGAKYGQKRCQGLPVDIRVCDYRDLNEKFDRIVSVGMIEHVGRRNYRTFFEVANRCLKDDGILVTHCIVVNDTKKVPIVDPWMNTYIFPGGSLPCPGNICEASDGLFIIEDMQNMGYHYHRTLMTWLDNFNKNWPSLRKNYKEPEKFYRMWTYYLIQSAAIFRARRMHVWQVVYTKKGLPGGYEAPR